MKGKNTLCRLIQGTTSSRAFYDRNGRNVGIPQKEFYHFSNDCWVEHSANEIWNSCSVLVYC